MFKYGITAGIILVTCVALSVKPRLAITQTKITVYGPTNITYIIEGSSDLTNWFKLAERNGNSSFDLPPKYYSMLFFRAKTK